MIEKRWVAYWGNRKVPYFVGDPHQTLKSFKSDLLHRFLLWKDLHHLSFKKITVKFETARQAK